MMSFTGARRLAASAILPALLAACVKGAPSPHTTLTGDVSVLRQAFNADSGKVRAVFLASPT